MHPRGTVQLMIGKNAHFVSREINISFIARLNRNHLPMGRGIRNHRWLFRYIRNYPDGVTNHNSIHPLYNQWGYLLCLHGKRYQTGITIAIGIPHPHFHIFHPCRIRNFDSIMDVRQGVISLTKHSIRRNLLQSRSSAQGPASAIHQIALRPIEHNGRQRQRIGGIARRE